MSISAKINGQFTPEFAAYTKLSLVNRVQNQVLGHDSGARKSSMNFQQFMEAIRKDQEVNHAYARSVSPEEATNNRIYEQNHGSSDFADRRYATIEKAYELGLVDRNGMLTASFQAEG